MSSLHASYESDIYKNDSEKPNAALPTRSSFLLVDGVVDTLEELFVFFLTALDGAGPSRNGIKGGALFDADCAEHCPAKPSAFVRDA